MSDDLREVTKKVDVIGRQAAIAVADFTDYAGLSVEDVKKVTDEVVKGLKRLPPAQPERKKAKWIATTSLQEGQITWRGEQDERSN